MPVRQLRFSLAFVFAPTVLSALLCGPITAFDGGPRRMWLQLFFFPTLAVTIGHSVLLGAPVAIALRKKNRLTVVNTVVAGALIGALPVTLYEVGHALIYSDWSLGSESPPGGLGSVLLTFLGLGLALALLGILGATIWWGLSGASSNNRWRGP